MGFVLTTPCNYCIVGLSDGYQLTIDELSNHARSDFWANPVRIFRAMEEKKLIRQPSLADQLLRILLDRIKEGVYLPGSQLPQKTN